MICAIGQVPGRPQGGRHGMVFAFRAAIQASPVTAHPSPTATIPPALIIGDYCRWLQLMSLVFCLEIGDTNFPNCNLN